MKIIKHYLYTPSVIFSIFLTALLFILSFFYIALPAIKVNFLNDKKEMIRELTTTTWKILQNYERRVRTGEFTKEEAQARAKLQIEPLRYGPEGKDYFWINDMHPTMIMHPYRKDLVGKDISDFQDKDGKFLFVEFVKAVSEKGEGYVDYLWQWKDDKTKVAPKLSYVKGFSPWGWIIGTGVYLDDIERKIDAITKNIKIAFVIVVVCLICLLFYIMVRVQLLEEEKRNIINALIDLKKQQNRFFQFYPDLVMTYERKITYINEAGISLLKAKNAKEVMKKNISDLFATGQKEKLYNLILDSIVKNEPFPFQEVVLVPMDGSSVDVQLMGIPFVDGEKKGIQLIART